MRTCIIGAGLAGLSAAKTLPSGSYVVLEKEKDVGGLCGSECVNGFYFDYAPHVFFTSDSNLLKAVCAMMKGNLVKRRRRAYIYIDGRHVEYPFEVNIRKLPKQMAVDCLTGFVKATNTGGNPRSFKEWIYIAYGEGIARHYLEPYNKKLWKYDLEDISVDWVAGRVPTPSVEEVIEGAFRRVDRPFGGNSVFFYPRRGGMGALPKALSRKVSPILLEAKVTEIRLVKDGLRVSYERKGKCKRASFKNLINTSPLPELVNMLHDVPSDVAKAASELKFNSLVSIGFGLKDRSRVRRHWVYYPEENYPFNRVSYPGNFSRFTVPQGCYSVLAEVTFKKGEERDLDDLAYEVEYKLREVGAIGREAKIVAKFVKFMKYAYVIHDLKFERRISIVRGYLDEIGVITAGRYGEWGYLNMDKAMLSGEKAARRLLSSPPQT